MPKIDIKKKEENLVKIDKIYIEQNAILIGDREVLVSSLQSHFIENNIEIDLFKVDRFEVLVDDIRAMRDWSIVSSDKLKVVILSSFYWNDSSQNAALKILEDTPVNTRIFFIATTSSLFLPTILSRVYVYDYRSTTVDDSLARELLALPIYLRLQNSKLKKLMALKIENVDLLKAANKVNDDSNIVDESESDDEVEESADDEEAGISSSKGRKNKEKHVQLFESLFDLVVRDFRSKSRGSKMIERQINYIQNINTLNKNIYQYGANPHLSIEYILLTYESKLN
jgi:DNA polymerase III delta prime subunit